MNNTPTPHNEAKLGDIAKSILLPGDPKRAKLIAEKFLTDAKLVNSVRNNLCYTGLYNGKPVSIMSTGMGCASMGIFSYELFNFYNVENAIRIGTIGAVDSNYKIGDIILAKKTITDSNYMGLFSKNGESTLECSKDLLENAENIAKEKNINTKTATIYTTDTFYCTEEMDKHQKELGIAGTEMECSALYLNAKNSNKKALTICTVSDERYSGRTASSDARQNLFLDMAILALDLITNL